jgi:hypothetical protein
MNGQSMAMAMAVGGPLAPDDAAAAAAAAARAQQRARGHWLL